MFRVVQKPVNGVKKSTHQPVTGRSIVHRANARRTKNGVRRTIAAPMRKKAITKQGSITTRGKVVSTEATTRELLMRTMGTFAVDAGVRRICAYTTKTRTDTIMNSQTSRLFAAVATQKSTICMKTSVFRRYSQSSSKDGGETQLWHCIRFY